MLLMFGTAVVASVGAALFARVRSRDGVAQLQVSRETQLHILKTALRANADAYSPNTAIATAPKRPLQKLEEAFKEFNFVADAREENGVSPIHASARKALNLSIPLIIKHLRDALDTSSSIDEKRVNVAVQLHGVLVDLLTPNGFLVQAAVKDLKASLRKSNVAAQGRMNRAYIQVIIPAIEYSLLETLKTLLRGSDRSEREEQRKTMKQLESHAATINKWAEKRISF